VMRKQQGTIHSIRIYPIKALCPVVVNEVIISPTEGFQHDREWALLDSQNHYVNGKSCPRVHDLRLLSFKPPSQVTLLHLKDQEQVSFDLSTQKDNAEKWFQKVIGKPDLRLVHKRDGVSGYYDDPRFDGPTIVSLNSLKTVEEWFGIHDAAERFRPNIIVDGVDAFWEDLLMDEDAGRGYKVRIGSSIDLVAVYPVHRCVVPTRAASTSDDHGKSIPEFIARFQKYRIDNFPKLAPEKRLTSAETNNAYHLCTACVILTPGKISVKDTVTVKDQIPLRSAITSVKQPMTKKNLRNVIDNVHSIRAISKTKHLLLSIMIMLLPAPFSSAIITSSLPDSIRKPTLYEILFAIGQSLLVLLLAWYLFHLIF